jgi:predicted HTH domain antitoxin
MEAAMETMLLEVTIPKDLFSMLGLSRGEVVAALKEFSVLGLYLEHRISAGKAAELMGIGNREFIRLLARKRIPYFDYTDEELDQEFRSLDDWQPANGSA